MTARLREQYTKEVAPALRKDLGIDNAMAVPRVEKVVLNMGLGEAVANPKIIDGAVEELSAIAGQKAVVTKAKKAIATYKLRAGMPIGARVTLRGDRMFEFLDRLINIALPRVRDFRGVSTKAFDGRGNYTLGIRDHFIFPEIDYSRTDKSKGLNVTIVTTAGRDDRARALLQALGMAFGRRKGVCSMAIRPMIIKANRKPKFSTRQVRRCRVCGRARSVLRKFQLCRICFRSNANAGYLPGVIKASW